MDGCSQKIDVEECENIRRGVDAGERCGFLGLCGLYGLIPVLWSQLVPLGYLGDKLIRSPCAIVWLYDGPVNLISSWAVQVTQSPYIKYTYPILGTAKSGHCLSKPLSCFLCFHASLLNAYLSICYTGKADGDSRET